MKRYFDANCASKESQLYGLPCSVQDNETVAELRQAISKSLDDGEAYIRLGDALSYQLRYMEAIRAYTESIGRLPQSMLSYQKRGGRYLTTLQLARAAADFDTCAAFGPNAEIAILSGLTAYLRGRYDEAKAHFSRWVALAGDDTEELISVLFWNILCCVRSGDDGGIRRLLAMYSPDMEVGHHTAYRCGMELFRGGMTPEEAMAAAEAAEGEDRDLEYGMIVYGVANYEYWRGNAEAYAACLDAILLRDTFWAGFASLAALNDRYPEVARDAELRGDAVRRAEALERFFSAHRRVALAFSGGVDSSYLLYAAKKCGCDVRPYLIRTQFQPRFEREEAERLAAELGIALTTVEYDVLCDPEVVQNPPDRCYRCKQTLFRVIREAAAGDGCDVVIDGTNASDDPTDRPGMKALEELGIRSPLRECGLTKHQIRLLCRQAGLAVWSKPAYACLATRIPAGTAITTDMLSKVEGSETFLMTLGFSDFRVRYFHGAAKLQLHGEQYERALTLRREIAEGLAPFFEEVLLDMRARS
jgi:uncharacterized protein